MNDVLDENEHLKQKLGIGPDDEVNLDEFRKTKAIKREEERAMVLILQQEVLSASFEITQKLLSNCIALNQDLCHFNTNYYLSLTC